MNRICYICFSQFYFFTAIVFLTSVLVYVSISYGFLTVHLNPKDLSQEVDFEICFGGAVEDLRRDSEDCPFLRYEFIRSPPAQLLTLFTTSHDIALLGEEFSSTVQLFNVTVQNWDAYKNLMQPVLYTHDKTIDKRILQSSNWNTHYIKNDTSRTQVIKEMFEFTYSQARYQKPFIGYAKPKVIFGLNFFETLTFISRIPASKLNARKVLIIGKSTGVTEAESRVVSNLPSNVTSLGKTAGKWLSPHVHDFIISTRKGYPWKEMPEFITGTPGYDFEEWVINDANKRGMAVIDITQTASVLQVEPSASKASPKNSLLTSAQKHRIMLNQRKYHHSNESQYIKKEDIGLNQSDDVTKRCVNMKLAQYATLDKGNVFCSKYFTRRDEKGKIRLLKRRNFNMDCKIAEFPRVTTDLWAECA